MPFRRIDEEILREMEQKQLLEEALNQANAAIVAKNTFLSNMSHDMRTPLNAIFGFTALAKSNIDDPQLIQSYLDRIEESDEILGEYSLYQIVVQDNGIGISEDFLEHIFEPFEREKNTTHSQAFGVGLGLTIVKNIVDRMGGDIEVSSTVGKGSTFTVTLRLRIQNDSGTNEDSSEDFYVNLPGKRILLVEDNEINMEIETELFEGIGFVIETAADGSIAVDKLKHSAPGYFSFVLMDIQMPVMNGYEAAKAIRRLKDPALSQIPIIALSANAFESDKQMSLESGMNEHLTKPIDIPLLLNTISHI